MSGAPKPPPGHGVLGELLIRHGARLRALVVQHCPSEQGLDPDDIEQEVRIRLWRAVERENNPALPASYIQRVVVTTVIDALRRSKPEQTTALPEAGQEAGIEALLDRVGPVRSASDGQRMDMVRAAIATLPSRRQQPVRLALQGFTPEEIGELLEMTATMAKNLMYRGLYELRDRLKAVGLDEHDDD
jgi:RNA polymerase sigma factor (sigma-70 family)